MTTQDVFSVFALVFGALAFYPQADKARRSGSTADLSFASFATLAVSLVFYAVYFALAGAGASAVLASVQVVPVFYILYLMRHSVC